MFRDKKRTTDPDQATRDDSTSADDGIVFTSNHLPHGSRVCLPEISLVAAIFEDAVRCVQRASRGVTHDQSSEAFEWIASDRRDWLFAFVNVCDFLGVDAAAVRKRLRIKEEGSGKGSRARVIESAGAGDHAM
jgi:hypothetical protein